MTARNDTDKSTCLRDGVIGAPAPRQNPRPGAVDITGEQNAQIVWRTSAEESLQCLHPDFGMTWIILSSCPHTFSPNDEVTDTPCRARHTRRRELPFCSDRRTVATAE